MNYSKNGYLYTIQNGLNFVRKLEDRFTKTKLNKEESIRKLKDELDKCDAIIIGAGSGLSTAAGYTYSGDRLNKYFFDFVNKYGIKDMYSAGFYSYESKEIFWAYWSRHIYINRYMDIPNNVYEKLLGVVKDKDYFVITTNVDHCFQRAGFDKKRLFYTQGDYGLFQSEDPTIKQTFDNKDWVIKAVKAQGFKIDDNGDLYIPENGNISMSIPSELIPKDPYGNDVVMNLRADDYFMEDEGWHSASNRYMEFIERHDGLKVIYLEIGVGNNTPVIIKYPFWQMTYDNKNSLYVCLNYDEAYCPSVLENRSICIDGDTKYILEKLK